MKQKQEQLIIETHNVNYNSNHIFTFTDTCPELLIIKGAIEMEQFLNNKHITSLPIKWYTNSKNNKMNNHNNKYKITNIFLLLMFIIMLFLFCVVFIFKFIFIIIV